MKSFRLIQFYSNRLIHSEGLRSATTRPVIRIAITGIILGTVAMMISIMVVTGFRNEITRKVTGFVADYRISAFNNNASFEEAPVKLEENKISVIKKINGVRHIQPFALKAGLLKSENDIQGVVLKGVNQDFEPGLFKEKLISGEMIVVIPKRCSSQKTYRKN